MATPPDPRQAGASVSPFGAARATIEGAPLSREEVDGSSSSGARATTSRSGMIYLRDNPLLRVAARPRAHQEPAARPLGREPGAVVRLDPPEPRDPQGRTSRPSSWPAPATAPRACSAPSTWREPTPRSTRTRGSTRRGSAASSRSSPSRAASAATARPETPGSIHEGGELGYVLSHACGAAFDNPDLIVAAVVGDGEAETGPLATSWHVEQVPEPGPRRRGAADPQPQRLQDQQPHPAGPHPAGRAGRAPARLRVDPVLRRGLRAGEHAPGDGGHPRPLRRRPSARRRPRRAGAARPGGRAGR